jgi:LacI family transcriptional regulator
MPILSQKEIARLAKVSQATVSRCLRNDPAQNPATRERIFQIAGKMGYVPNSFAAGLARARSADNKSFRANLAIIGGNQDNDPVATWKNWGLLYRSARQHAEKHGYSLEYFWRYAPGSSASQLRRVIEARGVMGVILLMISPEELDLPWDSLSLSSVCVSQLQPPRTHYVGVNSYHDACMGLQTSAKMGYRRPALAYPREEDLGQNEGAYTAAFLLHQQTLAPENRLPIFTKHSKEFIPWFNKYRPDVLFSMYGDLASKLGDRIPREVGFVNLSGLDYGVVPGCTYVHQRTDLAGIAALDLVTGQLSRNERGWPENPNCIVVPSEWHAGTTTHNMANTEPQARPARRVARRR